MLTGLSGLSGLSAQTNSETTVAPPETSDALLLEDGSYILSEIDDKILLEEEH